MQEIAGRKIDDLGRVCLPKEMRDELGMEAHAAIRFTKGPSCIIIEKMGCQLCGGSDDLIEYEGLRICRECFSKLCRACEENKAG